MGCQQVQDVRRLTLKEREERREGERKEKKEAHTQQRTAELLRCPRAGLSAGDRAADPMFWGVRVRG